MVVYDFEVYRYDWMICYLDTNTRKMNRIVNDKKAFEEFYAKYKREIWVGYNSRQYDQYIAKAILCDFDPFAVSSWIIEKDRKGFEYSKMLSKFPILNYDTIVGFKSLKELEAYMGHNIKETPIPFDIDRKLTTEELELVAQYCEHDVMETLQVFIEQKSEFESHLGLIKEFNLPIESISKTKAQLSATILGAVKKDRDDEFDIRFPDTMNLGKYSWIADWYLEWAKNDRNYETMSLQTEIMGVPHTFGIGGLHGSRDNYMGDGYYLMADVSSYYPALMIEYDFLSRNVLNPAKYRQIRDERLKLKLQKDPREYPRKIVLNSTFGAQKDKYNNLYDPLQANNICIGGQLLLVDLLEKLEGKCELISSNTDGILLKLFTKDDECAIMDICDEWSKRTRMMLEFDKISRVIQSNVNNYIIIMENGKVKRKGAIVKNLSVLDNDLPIVNRAVVDYFVSGIMVEKTICEATKLIDFQKITKIGGTYNYAWHNGKALNERVNRCFASLDDSDSMLMKKHKSKDTLDKIANTPEHCFIDNDDITEKPIPEKLDKQYYIDLAYERIKSFV